MKVDKATISGLRYNIGEREKDGLPLSSMPENPSRLGDYC